VDAQREKEKEEEARKFAAPAVPASVTSFGLIVGQRNTKERLATITDYCRMNKTAAEHFLIVGPDGMGKRTLAHAFGNELNVQVKELDATVLDRIIDFTGELLVLEPRAVIVVQNLENLKPSIVLPFLSSLRDYQLMVEIGQGPGKRLHPIRFNPFTCIATAKRDSDCPPEFKDVFAFTVPIEPYSPEDLQVIAYILARKLGLTVDDGALPLLASASGGTPHQLEVLLKRLARLGGKIITEASAVQILSTLGVGVTPSGQLETANRLQHLTGVQFEQLITALLLRMGFQARMTQASGDGGVDIVAVLDKPFLGGTYLVQCKKYIDALVGAPLIRDFYGAISADHKATKGIMVTTSGFTDEARNFANSVGIELIDGMKLNELLAEYGLKALDGVKSIPPARPRLF
jgi:Holliday junction resolvasome RuvABC ATP-dependent DNA helicase subunit